MTIIDNAVINKFFLSIHAGKWYISHIDSGQIQRIIPFCNPQHKSVMEVTVLQAQSIKISVKAVFPLQSCDQEPSIVSYIHLQKMNQRLIIL